MQQDAWVRTRRANSASCRIGNARLPPAFVFVLHLTVLGVGSFVPQEEAAISHELMTEDSATRGDHRLEALKPDDCRSQQFQRLRESIVVQ
jgi:hypothetical protein